MDSYNDKYLKYKTKYLNLKKIASQNSNKYVLSGGASNKTEIYLFKAEWCGHCKAFKSTWEKIQQDLKSKYTFITVDSDENKDQIQQWNIKGFPTIIKKTNDKAQEYIGSRDEQSVKEFIMS